MICRIEREAFRKAWEKIQVPEPRPYRPEGIIRLEADNGLLRLQSPIASAEVPADVEKRGVLFMPFYEFLDATGGMMKWEQEVYIEAHADGVSGNCLAFLCPPWQFAVFRDPATAPQTWAPTPPEDDLEPALDSSVTPA